MKAGTQQSTRSPPIPERGVVPRPSDTIGDMSPHPKTDKNPRGAGKSPRAGEASSIHSFRITASERSRFQAAADSAGQSLSEWIRAACEAQLAATAPPPKKGRKR